MKGFKIFRATPAGAAPRASRRRRPLLIAVRYVLPAVIVLAGLITFAVSPSIDTALGAAGVVGAGLSVWLLNFFYRVGVTGDRERDDESDARAFFAEHGHWPDQPPPARS